MGEHVATAVAKTGGTCDECGLAIGMFNRIFKYATDGGTTADGNGPGVWVCGFCHQRHVNELVPEVELWECASCLRMVNPAVVVDGKRFCFKCYGQISAEAGRLL